MTSFKFKYEEQKLFELLEFIELDPGAVSREASFIEIEEVGARKLPLGDQSARYFYTGVALEKGLLDLEYGASNFYELDGRPNYGHSVGYVISVAGREYLARKRAERLPNVWWRQILNNVPTIVVSVLSALAVGWAVSLWGPSP